MSDVVTVHVYGLYEGFANKPFYIGVTQNPRQRLSAHKAAAEGRRQDTLTGSGVDATTLSMRLLASCEERHTAEMIERALQEHFGITIVRRKLLLNKGDR